MTGRLGLLALAAGLAACASAPPARPACLCGYVTDENGPAWRKVCYDQDGLSFAGQISKIELHPCKPGEGRPE